jgi:hypothetical protein
MDIVKNINEIFSSSDYKSAYSHWINSFRVFIKLLFFNIKLIKLA